MQHRGNGYPIERDVDGFWIPDFEAKERRDRELYDGYCLPPEKQERAEFWDLFTTEFWSIITSQPLDYVTPLLRRLIDKSWSANNEDIHVDAIHQSIISLLYYAWDRAREVRKLRREVKELRAALRRLKGHAVAEYAAQERAMGRECGTS